MKQVNTGRSTTVPTVLEAGISMFKRKNDVKSSNLSRTMALVSSAVLFSLQLFSGKANAQIAHYTATNGTGTAVTYATNATGTALLTTGLGSNSPCSSGGLSGLTNNGVTAFNTANGHVYFTITANPGFALNITSATCKLRRSGSGIMKVRMAYYTTSATTVVNDLTDFAPDNTSCGGGSTVNSWNANGGLTPLPTAGVTTATFELFPYMPGASGGVVQINDITIGGTVVSVAPTCSAPVVGGTATPASSSVCGGSSVTLSVSGATSSASVTYQWQSTTDSIGLGWSNIPTATTTSYTAVSTPTVVTTTYYRLVTTCTGTGGSTANSSTVSITVNPTPSAGTITGSSLSFVGATTALSVSGASSGATIATAWESSNTSVGTIGSTGTFTGVFGGTTTVSYTVTDISTFCSATTTRDQSVVWPNTLALYAGANGTSTSVIGIANETVTALATTGFGASTPCTTGGLSGLTVPTTIATYNSANPHVFYKVVANPGHVLNVFRIVAKTRESATGPTKARLAYSVDGGASWIAEGADQAQNVGGSCGANSTTMNFNGPTGVGPTVIADSIIVAAFPFASTNSGGTFQLNSLEVYGAVSDTDSCTGAPIAGFITPTASHYCDSGFAYVSLDSGSFTGAFGPGISYQWQSSTDGSTWGNIPNATNTTYYTGELYAPTTEYYRVITSCSHSGLSDTSNVDTVTISTIPSAGIVTGGPILTMPTPVTFTASGFAAGGTTFWSSNDTSAASVDSAIGSATSPVTPKMPGIAVITFHNTINGCTGVARDTIKVMELNTLAVYWGTGGTSTTVTAIDPTVSVNALAASTGFGANTPCGSGGLSGLTVPTTIATYNSANPHVSFTMTPPATGVEITSIHVTTRSSTQGPQFITIAYSTDGGTTWNTNGIAYPADLDDCGFSHTDVTYTTTFGSTSPIMFAVYPFGSGNNTGTFQVNTFDVTGTTSCGGPVGAINDGFNGTDLNGEIYGYNCSDFAGGTIPLNTAVSGGTWMSSNTAAATVGSTDGQLVIISSPVPTADQSVTITYTSPCGVVATATFTVSATAGSSCDGSGGKAGHTSNVATNKATDVQVYPNPTNATLNIAASESVNVTIMSIDGKTLIQQNNATSINVAGLASGLYMIQVYNASNSLIKTMKFTKE